MTKTHNPFLGRFDIGNRAIGPGEDVLFIAEAGVAHFGDMALARDLVDLAADAKADVFKTQFFDVEELIAKSAADWRDRLRPRNLTLDQAHELKERCESRGLLFMSTAHDESRIPWLEALDVPALKIGSGERNNTPFITRLARLGKPMIVSTGMYGEDDVREVLDACATGGCDRVALLHCITSYPTPGNQVNLAAIDRMKAIFSGPVGYSDHTEDHLAVLAAVARGAHIVEKHITILRDVPNAQDWKVSAGPEDLANLVRDVRRTQALIGHGRKEPAPCEEPGIEWALKSLVAARPLEEGAILTAADLVAKRPGGGVSPNRVVDLIGKRLLRAVEPDSPVQLDDVE